MELVFLFIGIVINLIILLEAEKMTKEVKELFTRDPLCQDRCPLSNLSIQTKAGGGK